MLRATAGVFAGVLLTCALALGVLDAWAPTGVATMEAQSDSMFKRWRVERGVLDVRAGTFRLTLHFTAEGQGRVELQVSSDPEWLDREEDGHWTTLGTMRIAAGEAEWVRSYHDVPASNVAFRVIRYWDRGGTSGHVWRSAAIPKPQSRLERIRDGVAWSVARWANRFFAD